MIDKIPQEVLDNWANCEVPDCPNKCCLSLGSSKCYPHTVGLSLNYKGTDIPKGGEPDPRD